MPTRYLKPGVRDSELIDQLSPIAEILFYRLLVTVDDFGRYDARPAIIKAQCFPIKDSINAKHCQEALYELANNDLITLYSIDSKPYLQMSKWDNVPRAKESKFPECDADSIQLHAIVCKPHTDAPLTETVTVTKTETLSRKNALDEFDQFWQKYPKKKNKADALKAWGKIKPPIFEVMEALSWQIKSNDWQRQNGQFIPYPASYIRGGSWLDEPIKDEGEPF